MATKNKTRGRRKGSQNKGYWFRQSRGWVVTLNGKPIPLCNEHGVQLKNRKAKRQALDVACRRFWSQQKANAVQNLEGDTTPLYELCKLYLDAIKDKKKSYGRRADLLFDFCSGYLGRYRTTGVPNEVEKVHDGYGTKPVGALTPLDVQRWLDSHEGWGETGARRTAVQALKRALNWAATEMRVISRNPIRGFKVSKGRARVTYFSPEVEQAMLKDSKPALASAIKVLIRTGARYGCEFCRLTAKHVSFNDKGIMFWTFSSDESKTGRERIIRINPQTEESREIIQCVNKLIKRHPKGALFFNTQNEPWTTRGLSAAFNRLKKRLLDKGVELGPDACLYSLRHTYAKRMLAGYWTGKPITIETLCALMGNTRQVCWEYYGKWCPAYQDPLNESA